ncbi:MAG: bifunctional glycosyltransferase family 2/GtrA family protein [Propionibacteriaceae bacterium]|nr:bifunctional glycosyltransferase family 2/GtrA family protein [Propionibacteriaceae bacterium]
MVILIPSDEPDRKLLALLEDLPDQNIVIVDDGSGSRYAHWFAAAERTGADVVHHRVNRGKGQALRTGFDYITRHFPGESVICADSDGQHTPSDIAKVAETLERTGADMVLGVRKFTGTVPLRSRLGNSVTTWLFRAATGLSVSDTQTGLRAYPARMLGWLSTVEGDRFEYELNALLLASKRGLQVEQVTIETIYLDDNASSHFRPIRDSWLIYRPLLGFIGSSLLGFVVDCTVLALLLAIGGSLTLSVIGARLVSATVNYTVNRRYVFARGRPLTVRETLPGYVALATVILVGNLILMWTLTPLTGAAVAKILTEVALLTLSYIVQATWVFAHRHRDVAPDPTPRSDRITTVQKLGVS